MDEILMIDAAERYLNGEMNADEKALFEQMRQTNPEMDQLVVEHIHFLQEFKKYGTVRELKHVAHEVHSQLLQEGKIKEEQLTGTAKVVNLWKRYKRTISIAASIDGITALSISGITLLIAPKNNSQQILELGKKVDRLNNAVKIQDNKINNIVKSNKIPSGSEIKGGGSAFLIDGKGYLVTSAHIIKKNKNGIIVTNNKGEEFRAEVVKTDAVRDITILKIEDEDFKPVGSIPYGIRKSSTDIAEPIFTTGYPDNKFVYGEGYLSSITGFNGDTLSCQIAVAANPGNSGGPVFNHNGEVIGILSTREVQAEGVVFAIQSKYIIEIINELKKSDTSAQKLKLPAASQVRGMDRVQQVKKIQDYIYMVNVY
jgi:S1-C subfamily serine protease